MPSTAPLIARLGTRIAGLLAMVCLAGAAHASGPIAGITQVAVGSDHTCALTTSGRVRCWGANYFGQLGNGTTTDSAIPVTVAGITGATAIATARNMTCARSASGVQCWGDNTDGQLGDGSSGSFRSTPVMVIGSAGATTLAVGGRHACMRLAGVIKCWGSNGQGQLGDGTINTNPSPVTAISGLARSDFVRLALGSGHSCAIINGAVKCWGDNVEGQLGTGDYNDQLVPSNVPAITSHATEIAAGSKHTCAIVANTLQCWGINLSGGLGNGSVTRSPVPVDVSNGTNATYIAAGADSTCAILGGTAHCWGSNSYGLLGTGNTLDSPIPVAVPALGAGVAAISIGSTHACAVMAGSDVQCQGDNTSGQLGNGTTGLDSIVATAVPGLGSGIVVAAAGWTHACAVLSSGAVKCWGRNDDGQLGDGSQLWRSTPTAVSGITNATTVAAGGWHSCAIVAGGAIKCWGDNASYQLGNDSTTGSRVPVLVPGISDATAVAAGGWHSCALLASGTVKCWGNNEVGQLGNPSVTDDATATPVLVSGISGATAIAAGLGHTCAILANGVIKCWGYNSSGQLGNNTTTDASLPVPVSTITSAASSLTGGAGHTCAVVAGTVKCWGNNEFGQLGSPMLLHSLVPVTVSDIASAASHVASGFTHTCAIVAGAVKCWGNNDSGQLGDGSHAGSLQPVSVVSIAGNATGLTAGGTYELSGFTCAVINGGLRCWGSDTFGQLGDGRSVLVPVTVIAMPPSPPTLLRLIPGHASMRVFFTPSDNDGGADIGGYTATCTGGGQTFSASGASSPITVTGLTDNTAYTCSIHATNSGGSSSESSAMTKIARRPASIVPFLSILND